MRRARNKCAQIEREIPDKCAQDALECAQSMRGVREGYARDARKMCANNAQSMRKVFAKFACAEFTQSLRTLCAKCASSERELRTKYA